MILCFTESPSFIFIRSRRSWRDYSQFMHPTENTWDQMRVTCTFCLGNNVVAVHHTLCVCRNILCICVIHICAGIAFTKSEFTLSNRDVLLLSLDSSETQVGYWIQHGSTNWHLATFWLVSQWEACWLANRLKSTNRVKICCCNFNVRPSVFVKTLENIPAQVWIKHTQHFYCYKTVLLHKHKNKSVNLIWSNKNHTHTLAREHGSKDIFSHCTDNFIVYLISSYLVQLNSSV